MKKLSLSFLAILLAGCGVSINHNIATINGKTYLVETKNYTDGFGTIWSKPPTFHLITEEDIVSEMTAGQLSSASAAKAELARLAAECNIQAVKAQARPNYKKAYKCVVEKLAELEGN
jgi:hypothetical protein